MQVSHFQRQRTTAMLSLFEASPVGEGVDLRKPGVPAELQHVQRPDQSQLIASKVSCHGQV
jgi:hypothetical protein